MNVFIFDFDGTITTEDSTDLILGIPDDAQVWQIEEDWKRGKITSYECMKAQARYLNGITTERIRQHLKQHSHLDPSFPTLVGTLEEMRFHPIILSEGYDLSISFHDVQNQIKEIYSSKLLIADGRLTGELKVSNERRRKYNTECIGCCICKVDFLHQLRSRANVTKAFAVGDGRSDACLFSFVDVSFSLTPQHKATHQVRNLSEVLEILVNSQTLLK
jgi:HAD superfamily phosphoserine phosphatase-like hydrolase